MLHPIKFYLQNNKASNLEILVSRDTRNANNYVANGSALRTSIGQVDFEEILTFSLKVYLKMQHRNWCCTKEHVAQDRILRREWI